MGSIKHFDRIANSKSFDKIYKKPSKIWHTHYFVIFYLGDDTHKVAFVASKKVGNAVERNRAKRLLRALFLTQIDKIASGQYIFVAKKPLINEKFDTLSNTFRYALKRSGALTRSGVSAKQSKNHEKPLSKR